MQEEILLINQKQTKLKLEY